MVKDVGKTILPTRKVYNKKMKKYIDTDNALYKVNQKLTSTPNLRTSGFTFLSRYVRR